MATPTSFARYRRDPAAFIEEVLVNPENSKPFELLDYQRELLREMVRPDGSVPYRTVLLNCIKKSGKSTTAALVGLWAVLCAGGRYAEGYVISSDLQQSTDRIFTMAQRVVECSPMLRAKITADKILFANGSFLQALASDWRGAAGSAPTVVLCDELWTFTSESARRLYEEAAPTPTRKPSFRFISTYAGFTGESDLLEKLVERGKKGNVVAQDLYAQRGLLAHISHGPLAPWQTPEWLEECRQTERPSAFLRQYRNEFTSGEGAFVSLEDYDACVGNYNPPAADTTLDVYVGLDASVKHDSTALVAVAWREGRMQLIAHREYKPSKDQPIDFAATVEQTLLEWKGCYRIREVAFDPYQLQAVAQNMRRSGIVMNEFLQTPGNLSEVATRLYNLISERKVQFYSCPGLRTAFSNAIAVESTRGWRIDKAKQSHRIDLVIALGMAVTAAMRKVETGPGTSADEWIALYRKWGEQATRRQEVGRRDGPTAKLTPGELRRFEMQAGYCTDCGQSLLGKRCVIDGAGMHCGCPPAPIAPKPGTIVSHTRYGPRRVF
jgi:phage terminase large subunit-like protein